MRTFTIQYGDLDYSIQADIEQELAKDIKQDLIDEAKEEYYKTHDKSLRFGTGDLLDFMCDPKGYALDKNNFHYEFTCLVDEMVAQRIRQNFTSLRLML